MSVHSDTSVSPVLASGESTASFRCQLGYEIQVPICSENPGRIVVELHSPHELLRVSEALEGVVVHRGHAKTYEGRAVVANVVSCGYKTIAELALSESGGTRARDGAGGAPIDVLIDQWLRQTHEAIRIDSRLRAAVSDLQTILSGLQRTLSPLDAVGADEAASPRSETGDAVYDSLYRRVAPLLGDAFGRLERALRLIHDGDAAACGAYLKRALHPLTLCAPFMHRTFTKPMGYAGDYAMVRMMFGPQFVGPSTYAKVLNAFFLNTPPVKAHRNRITFLQRRLREEAVRCQAEGRPFRVFNLGCGPAVELQTLLRESSLRGPLELTLVDFNQETLDYAAQAIRSSQGAGMKLTALNLHNRSVAQLIREGGRSAGLFTKASYDFVYCAGLFDYLSDPVAASIVRVLLERVSPGGMFVVTNVEEDNPSRGWMEYAVDWFLFHRTPEEMRLLLPEPLRETDGRVFVEQVGLNLLMELRRE